GAGDLEPRRQRRKIFAGRWKSRPRRNANRRWRRRSARDGSRTRHRRRGKDRGGAPLLSRRRRQGQKRRGAGSQRGRRRRQAAWRAARIRRRRSWADRDAYLAGAVGIGCVAETGVTPGCPASAILGGVTGVGMLVRSRPSRVTSAQSTSSALSPAT